VNQNKNKKQHLQQQQPQQQTQQQPQHKHHHQHNHHNKRDIVVEHIGPWSLSLERTEKCIHMYPSGHYCVDVYPYANNPQLNKIESKRIAMDPYTGPKNKKHVTLASQMTITRMNRLQNLVGREIRSMNLTNIDITVSIAVLSVNVTSDWELIRNTVYNNRKVCIDDWCSKNLHIHLVHTKKIDPYPINLLRNVALLYSNGNWLFLYDIDFIPSRNLAEQMAAILPSDYSVWHKKSMYIIPAFDFSLHTECTLNVELNHGIKCAHRVPASKKDIVEAWKKNLVRPFHQQIFKRGHSSTNFGKWLSFPDVSEHPNVPLVYNLPTHNRYYEPYVIFPRDMLVSDDPSGELCSPKFFDRGLNKIVCIQRLKILGLRFKVSTQSYLVHFLEKGEKKPTRLNQMEGRDDLHKKLQREWVSKYGASRVKKHFETEQINWN
jgi:hypothetical protein